MRIALCCAEDFNLGVAYLLAYLKKEHDVRLFFDPRQFSRGYAQNKFLAKLLSVEDYLVKNIVSWNPDIVGISCITANYPWARRVGEAIRRDDKRTRIIFGGVHPTLCPEEIKDDFEVCVGDGIKHFGGNFDPDELWADREPFWSYLPPIHRQTQIFLTGFGCPFRCSFCNNHQLHRKPVRRSPEGCIRELKHLKDRGMRYVLFDDDIFTLNYSWLSMFLPAYKKTVTLPFTCFGHPKYLSNDTLKVLKQAKCQMIWLGIQTENEHLRRTVLNRFETNKEIIKACKLIKSYFRDSHRNRGTSDRIAPLL
jgi:radical SAM superfamily enzyme YgiQ (UPF0313 family)